MKRLPLEDVVERIRRIHAEIRDRLVAHIQAQASEALSAVVGETAGDTIYAVDRVGEWVLRELFERELARETSFVLVGEGLADEGEVFPDGTDPDAAAYRVIVDPIDGTRALMYDKRSAWVLTGWRRTGVPGRRCGTWWRRSRPKSRHRSSIVPIPFGPYEARAQALWASIG